MGDCPHGEQAEHVTAADAHKEVEDVVRTDTVLTGGFLVHETLEEDEDGGEGECEHWDDVPAVCWILNHQRVDHHRHDGAQDHQVPPRSREDQARPGTGCTI